MTSAVFGAKSGRSLLLIAVILNSCGVKSKTGRNGDPGQWPKSPPHASSTKPAENQHDPKGQELHGSCFESKQISIPVELQKICSEQMRAEPAFKELIPLLCENGMAISSLGDGSCGWDGDPKSINNFTHYYSIQPDPSQDYEDVHESLIHLPSHFDQVIHSVSGAFENYDEFRRQGHRWVSGTRESKNLSGTKIEQGVKYRFRADKDVYEIGYQGFVQLFYLSPTLAIQINHATGDFERVTDFAQAIIFQELPDKSTLFFNLEHRKISSQGLYERAKRNGAELVNDIMEKVYANATN